MESSKPARKVVTRAPARTVRILNLNGVLPHPVEAESKLEADCVRRTALCPVTKAVLAQPFTLPVSPEGYTPDYLITTVRGARVVVEVKLASKVAGYGALFDLAAEYLRGRQHRFIVATEKSIRAGAAHQRALLILRYAKAAFPPADTHRALEFVKQFKEGIPLGAVLARATVPRELIFHLIGKKKLTTGSRLSIDDSALVFIPTAPETNDEDFLARWLDVAPW